MKTKIVTGWRIVIFATDSCVCDASDSTLDGRGAGVDFKRDLSAAITKNGRRVLEWNAVNCTEHRCGETWHAKLRGSRHTKTPRLRPSPCPS